MSPLFAPALWVSLVTSANIPSNGPISNDIDSIGPIGIPPCAVQDRHATHNPDPFKEAVDPPKVSNGVVSGDQRGNDGYERDTKAHCASDNDCHEPAHCYQGICRVVPPLINIKPNDDVDGDEKVEIDALCCASGFLPNKRQR